MNTSPMPFVTAENGNIYPVSSLHQWTRDKGRPDNTKAVKRDGSITATRVHGDAQHGTFIMLEASSEVIEIVWDEFTTWMSNGLKLFGTDPATGEEILVEKGANLFDFGHVMHLVQDHLRGGGDK